MASAKKKPAKKAAAKKIKIKLAYYIKNAGDGSAYIKFFNSEADAEDYAKDDDERYCDDIGTKELIVDEKGHLLNPAVKEDW